MTDPSEDSLAALARAYEELKAENHRLRLKCESTERQLASAYRFLDTPLIGLTYMLRDGTIRLINGRGARNLQRTAQELIGGNMYDVVPALAEQTRARIEQTLDTGRELDFETMIDLPSGRRWFRSTYYPMEATDTEPEMVQLVSQDMTELKHAEQALAATEGRLSTVLEHAPHVIAILDRDTLIRYINRAPPGQSLDDIIGTPAAVQMAAIDLPAFERAFEAVLQSGKPQLAEVVGATGRSYELRLAPIISDGELRQVLTFAVDITERHAAQRRERELEAQVLHAQKMESLGVLAGGIAHDFNNLLVGVMGNAELALRAPTPELVTKRMQDIVQAAQRAADLCRQMLAYAGRGQLRREVVDIRSLSKEVLDLVRASFSKRIRIRCECDEALSTVEGDATQLRQVVMNLLTNAAEALGAEDGEIILRCGQVEWDGAGTEGEAHDRPTVGQYVFVEVGDTGCGMDEEERRRMFEPFYTSKQLGSGLGLSATLGIIRSHGGGIIVDTALGLGTTIRVLLPASSKASPYARRRPNIQLTQGRTILVVDDEPAVRKVIRELLKQAGHHVLLASDGKEALVAYDQDPDRIAAVVTDLSMPGMDGLQIARELRKRNPHLPILLASGFSDDRLANAEANGPVHFIPKPFEVDELLALLHELLET